MKGRKLMKSTALIMMENEPFEDIIDWVLDQANIKNKELEQQNKILKQQLKSMITQTKNMAYSGSKLSIVRSCSLEAIKSIES